MGFFVGFTQKNLPAAFILRLSIGQETYGTETQKTLSVEFKWPICKVFSNKLTCNRPPHHLFRQNEAYRICHIKSLEQLEWH